MARKQAWSPRTPGSRPRLEIFEEMARSMVGDGKRPDIFFVSAAGNIVTITLDFETAYEEWIRRDRGAKIEITLEDRLFGIIASVGPVEDGSKEFIRIDSSRDFIRMYGPAVWYREG
jgi:hypothetical protein